MVAAAVIGGVSANNSAKKGAQAAKDASQRSVESSERIQQRQLDLSEKEFAAAEKRNATMDALTQKVTASQLESQAQQNALAKEYADYNRTTFRPLEQDIVNEAETFDSQERQDAEAGKVSTDYAMQVAGQKAGVTRNLARMGMKPTDGRYMEAMGDPASEALGAVTVRNTARERIRTLGSAKRMDAASLGRGLPSAQATSAGLALTAGNSAVGNQTTANGSAVSGLGAGITLLNGAANTGNSIANNSNQLFNTISNGANQTQSAIGSAAGMALNYYMNNKTPVKPAGGQ